jgi:hypothetical protein
VLVLTLADRVPADATAAIATGVRTQLRPWDLVGVLGDQEIGFLLYDASSEQVDRVIGRIRSFVDLTERARVAAVGVAARDSDPTGLGGIVASSSLVQEARAHALRRNVA